MHQNKTKQEVESSIHTYGVSGLSATSAGHNPNHGILTLMQDKRLMSVRAFFSLWKEDEEEEEEAEVNSQL